MTIRELLDVLAARGSTLAAYGDRLRHRERQWAEGDPVRRALATFHDEILYLVTTGRLCCFCPRLLAEGDRIACAQHRAKIRETPMAWENDEPCRNENGVCQDQAHDRFDDHRAEQEDAYLEHGVRVGAA